jgi:F0F1-type ATP synthase assembly protein I
MDKKEDNKVSDRSYYLFALKIIGDFGAAIAAPVVIFVLIGQWLDGKYDKGPLFTIIAFILAAAISAKIIHKRAKQYGKEYQALVDKEKEQLDRKKKKETKK